MEQETILTAIFFTFMLGAGIGFFVARLIF